MPRMIYTTSSQKEGTEEYVTYAVRAGFQGVQTSGQVKHFNEPGVGRGLQSLFKSGVDREKLFIQTSVNPFFAAELSPDAPIAKQVEASIANSLSNLGLEYIDSLLLDSPYTEHDQTME